MAQGRPVCDGTRIHALLTWVWLLLALPFLTNTSCDLFIGLPLGCIWLLLGAVWLVIPFAPPTAFYIRAKRNCWLASGFAGLLGLVLAFTDLGLIVRVALSESSLSAYATQVAPRDGDWGHEPRLVGLFLVDGESNEEGIVYLYTGKAFIDRTGLALVPAGGKPSYRVRHLYGPWYWFYWKF
jgi:hypothetical protein